MTLDKNKLKELCKSQSVFWSAGLKQEELLALLAELEAAERAPRFKEDKHVARMVEAGCLIDFNGENLVIKNKRAEAAEERVRELTQQRDDHFSEIQRARKVIDGMRAVWEASVLLCGNDKASPTEIALSVFSANKRLSVMETALRNLVEETKKKDNPGDMGVSAWEKVVVEAEKALSDQGGNNGA